LAGEQAHNFEKTIFTPQERRDCQSGRAERVMRKTQVSKVVSPSVSIKDRTIVGHVEKILNNIDRMLKYGTY
jgi:hypothetical protein